MPLRSRAVTISVARAPERAEVHLAAEDVAAAAGISRLMLSRLVRAGLIEPATPDGTRFTAASASRLRRMLRLRRDLGVNLIGAAIILDLVERLEQKERR